MAKDPAFLFYSSDFLLGVSDLSMEERGQYITLLCIQHQKGELSEKMISLTVGNVSTDVLLKFVQLENGNFKNLRLEEEIKKRREYSLSRSNNRKGNKDIKNISETHEEDMVNVIVNKKEDIEERKENFRLLLVEYVDEYGKDMVREFFDYWSEPNKSKKKMRFEGEKYFHIGRRLGTWRQNNSKFKKPETPMEGGKGFVAGLKAAEQMRMPEN